MTTRRVILVTDVSANETLADALRENGFDVFIERRPAVADERLLALPAELLVVDISDAGAAIEFVRKVRSARKFASTPLLVIAEWGTGQATLALNSGADAFEPKPIGAKRLLAAVDELLRPDMAMTARASGLDANED